MTQHTCPDSPEPHEHIGMNHDGSKKWPVDIMKEEMEKYLPRAETVEVKQCKKCDRCVEANGVVLSDNHECITMKGSNELGNMGGVVGPLPDWYRKVCDLTKDRSDLKLYPNGYITSEEANCIISESIAQAEKMGRDAGLRAAIKFFEEKHSGDILQHEVIEGLNSLLNESK